MNKNPTSSDRKKDEPVVPYMIFKACQKLCAANCPKCGYFYGPKHPTMSGKLVKF